MKVHKNGPVMEHAKEDSHHKYLCTVEDDEGVLDVCVHYGHNVSICVSFEREDEDGKFEDYWSTDLLHFLSMERLGVTLRDKDRVELAALAGVALFNMFKKPE